jgi:hypothetical protein
MAAKKVRTHGPCMCTIEVTPGEVDAGTELTVRARASCPEGCDLRGQSVAIRNAGDDVLATAEIAEFEGYSYVTHACVLRAPLDVGDHVYRAVIAAQETGGVRHEESAATFSFATRAHAASVNVWGLPSAIAAGERFGFKVGVKCSAGCKLTGAQWKISDHDGVEVASGNLSDEAWPGTSALYFAEPEATAPPAAGNYEWRVDTVASPEEVPHADGALVFAVRIVRPPDFEVTVEAFDAEKQSPIAGAHVMLHPYRTFTDETGVAKLKVAKGRYRLSVSGFNYLAHQDVIDVDRDVIARAELMVEPEGQEDYR